MASHGAASAKAAEEGKALLGELRAQQKAEALRVEGKGPGAGAEEEMDPRIRLISINALFSNMSGSHIFPLLPSFARESGISASALGVILSAPGFSRIFVNVPCTVCADTLGRRPVFLASCAMLVAGSVFMAVMHDQYSLFLGCCLTGLGYGANTVAGLLSIADLTTPATRGKALGPIMTAVNFSRGIGPALAGAAGEFLGFEAAMWAFAAVFAAPLAILWFFFYEPLAQPKPVPTAASLAADYKAAMNQDVALCMLNQFMLSVVLGGGVYATLPSFCGGLFEDMRGAGALGMVFAALAIGQSVVSYPAGWLGDKFGRKGPLVGCDLAMALSLFALSLCTTKAAVFTVLVPADVGMGMSMAILNAYVTDVCPKGTASKALSWLTFSRDFGFFVGPMTAGALTQASSAAMAFQAIGLLALFVTIISAFFLNNTVVKK